MYDDPERFGRDEHDGGEIPFERLDLIPWARRRVGGQTERAT
jgi:RNA polymerase-binding transcription factor DksA